VGHGVRVTARKKTERLKGERDAVVRASWFSRESAAQYLGLTLDQLKYRIEQQEIPRSAWACASDGRIYLNPAVIVKMTPHVPEDDVVDGELAKALGTAPPGGTAGVVGTAGSSGNAPVKQPLGDVSTQALVHHGETRTRPLGADGLPSGPVDPNAAMAMFWRGGSDMLRSMNAAQESNQNFTRQFVTAFLDPLQDMNAMLKSTNRELTEENHRLREKIFEGFKIVEEAASRSNERDLAILQTTQREQRFAETFAMLRELAPRVFEQFIGIRNVKKEIGKLDEKQVAMMLNLIPDPKVKALIKGIYDEEQARVVRLQSIVTGKKPDQEKPGGDAGNGAESASTERSAANG
jgi:hypothetical protein